VVAKFGEAQTFTLIAYFSAWYILILVIDFCEQHTDQRILHSSLDLQKGLSIL